MGLCKVSNLALFVKYFINKNKAFMKLRQPVAFASIAVFFLLMPVHATAQPLQAAAGDLVLSSKGVITNNPGSGTLILLTGNASPKVSIIRSGIGNPNGILHGNDSTSASAIAPMPPGYILTSNKTSIEYKLTDVVMIYPYPFSNFTNIRVNDGSQNNSYEMTIYNASGTEVLKTTITGESTIFETGNLPSGIYNFKIRVDNNTIRSGRMILQR
jgi:hypothetical protein